MRIGRTTREVELQPMPDAPVIVHRWRCVARGLTPPSNPLSSVACSRTFILPDFTESFQTYSCRTSIHNLEAPFSIRSCKCLSIKRTCTVQFINQIKNARNTVECPMRLLMIFIVRYYSPSLHVES